jgi:hypothetical protein
MRKDLDYCKISGRYAEAKLARGLRSWSFGSPPEMGSGKK